MLLTAPIELTPTLAYLIGFFAADGCLRHERGGVCKRALLKVRSYDASVCDLAKAAFGGGSVRISGADAIYNGPKTVCEFLEHYGLTPRKTFTLSIRWDRIPALLHGAVLAGLIDGDGHIRWKDASKTRGAGYEIKLVTASDALKDELLAQFPGYFRVVTRPAGVEGSKAPLHRLLLETNQTKATQFFREVYPAGVRELCLPRKWVVAAKIEAHLLNQANYDMMRAQIPAMFLEKGMTIKEIAAETGLNRAVVGRIIKEFAPGTKTRRWEFTAEDLQTIRELWKQGESISAIHRALGKATFAAVHYQVKKLKDAAVGS